MRVKLFLICVVLILGSIAGSYIAIAQGLPPISELKKYRPTDGTKIFADDDSLIGEFKVEKGIFVPLSKMPANLKNAIVAVEDSRFWQHKGIDYIGIARAVVKDIMYASLKEGGSTITQQLAKIMFLSPEKTIQRKLKEAQLAIKLEKELTKKEILELYLNRTYFGHGAYGVEMASRIYFGKPVSKINLPEAALLAGLVKAPNTYSPYNNLVKAKERQQVVLLRMQEEGYITPSQMAAAKKQTLPLSSLRTNSEALNYFLEYIRQELEQRYGIETVYKGGMRVYTTLDKNAQVIAQKALQEGLRAVDKRKGWRGAIGRKANLEDEKSADAPRVSFSASAGDMSTGVVLSVKPKEAVVKARGITGTLSVSDALWARTVVDAKTGKIRHIKKFRLTEILREGDIILVRFKSVGKEVSFSLEQTPEVEGALVALDPETGFVRAVVGGYSFTTSEFNRALYARRQPGSAFKPVIYAAALENGFSPSSIIIDEPVSYPAGRGREWTPENYDHKNYGPTPLREALAYSRNVVTVKLLDEVGIDKVISFARDLGIKSDIPRDLTMALGSISTTPIEMAVAYTAFANRGVRVSPVMIKYIRDRKGKVLESHEPEGIEVMTPRSSYLLTTMMEDVISFGTGAGAFIGRPAAGKTGTSNDYKDAWFIGYTPQLVGCVWVGFDNMRRSLGPGEVGGRAAAPIWSDFMKKALSGVPVEEFQAPEAGTDEEEGPEFDLQAAPERRPFRIDSLRPSESFELD